MAVTTAIVAVAGATYTAISAKEAQRKASQEQDAAKIDAETEKRRQQNVQAFNDSQAAMVAARNQSKNNVNSTLGGTLLTPLGTGSAGLAAGGSSPPKTILGA